MEKHIMGFMAQHGLIQPGDKIGVALSGGRDSIALLHFLCTRRETLQISVCAIHINHGLREESTAEALFAEKICKEWDVPLRLSELHMGPEASSLETTARALRYEVFARIAEEEGLNKIATAHHAMDQAETMLFRMARGTGLRGLGGIRPQNGIYIRPLLSCTRDMIDSYLQRNGLSWVEDCSNYDTRFSRNAIRAEVFPKLFHINAQCEEHFAQTALALQADEAYLEAQARAHWDAEGHILREAALSGLPEALSARLARFFLEEQGADEISYQNLQDILALRDGDRCSLCGLDLVCEDGIIREYQPDSAEEWELVLPEAESGRLALPDGREFQWEYLAETPNIDFKHTALKEHFALVSAEAPAVLRNRREGDFLGSACGRKSLQDYFVDEKISRASRDQIVLLTQGAHVLYIDGTGRVSDFARVIEPRPENTKVLHFYL